MSFFLLLLAASMPVAAVCPTPLDLTCGYQECRAPASAVPSQLWGDLAPTDTDLTIPGIRDNTDFNEFMDPFSYTEPHWMSLDIENGWIFAALHQGVQIWSTTTSGGTPEDPHLTIAFGSSRFPHFAPDPHEYYPIRDLDAPPGNTNVLAVSQVADGGLTIFDTSNKTNPIARYADINKKGFEVYAARIGANDYAFMASRDAGLLAYNMTAAGNLLSVCQEETPGQQGCGVYVARLGTSTVFQHVDGAGNASNTKHWVVGSFGGADDGVEIWDVSNPASPQLELTGLSGFNAMGVALWRRGSSYYLATRARQGSTNQARIYNVSCIATGTCGSLGSPIFTLNLNGGASEAYVTYSSTGTRDFVYFGTVDRCLQGTQGEWLFDVTTPSQAVDITPPAQMYQGELTGYWGWYYRRNPTGFNRVAPRVGKFNGDHFYRAAFTLFDIHRLTGGIAPTANFTWNPQPVYKDQPIDFIDQSSGSPTSWNWTFPAGVCDGMGTCDPTAQNPQDAVFTVLGTNVVTLTVSNGAGTSPPKQEMIEVLDPDPAVGGVNVSPNPALLCQPVTFTAQNVTGLPPLSYSWEVKDAGAAVVASGSGNPFQWDTAGAATGAYTGTVTVTNTGGSAMAVSPTLTLQPLPPLPGAMTFAPTFDPFTAGTVQFHVSAAGATEWNWDFRDGTSTGWISDPVDGPNPLHSYTAIGSYDVTVMVRNCQEGPVASAPTTVDVTSIAPLVANFQAQGVCSFGVCVASVGQVITFQDLSLGSPDFWDYDWAGDGTFENPNNSSPITSHTYNTAGTYTPTLMVRRGGESDTFVHALIVVSSGGGGGGNPFISISGPTSGEVNENLSYSATGTNCTPNPSGWTWAAGDGQVSGNTSSSQVTVAWPSAGSKTVTAQNSACGTAQGTRTVIISNPGGGGGGGNLNASFTFSPTNPGVDQQVSFDATSSSGSPDAFEWDFGDGTSGEGVQVTHSYSQAGAYQVELTVETVNDPSCPPFNVCTDAVTHALNVGGGGGGGNGLMASFETSASCVPLAQGIQACEATVGQLVSFTSTSTGAVSLEWNFGDGTMAEGMNVSHSWSAAGEFQVVLTASDGEGGSDTAVGLFDLTQTETGATLLPWIADTSGALEQTSDLYVYNPNTSTMTVEITFRKRGLPQTDPPRVTQAILAGETLYVPDALQQLFGLSDTTGFLFIEALESLPGPPVVVSFNRTFQANGDTYGQMVPGISMNNLDAVAASGSGVQYLLGLTDTSEKHTYFGITNAHPDPALYHLRVYDHAGNLLAETQEPFAISRWGQKQFQRAEIFDLFGIADEDDYRVEIEQVEGGTLYAYGGVVRQGTQDPSFHRVSVPNLPRAYLVGVANTPGFNNAFFQTDAVVSNPTTEAMALTITFLNVGFSSEPEDPIVVGLAPNETLRLADLLPTEWGIDGGVGVLFFDSAGVDGRYPMVFGETFQNSGPQTRYGLFMPARRDGEVAMPGQRVVLTGLRQKDDDSNTTLWLLNPSDLRGEYDIVYRGLDGSELGRQEGYVVGAQKVRQINPSFHPLPAGGVDGGFTLEVEVKEGRLIVGAQVVLNQSNDPAYLSGVVR